MTLRRTSHLAAITLSAALGLSCTSGTGSGGGDQGGPTGPNTPEPQPPNEQPEPNVGSVVSGTEPPRDLKTATSCVATGATKDIDGLLVDAHGTASATRAREALDQSRAPLPATLRAADFQNYYPPLTSQSNPGNVAPPLRIEAQPRLVGNTVTGQWDVFVGLEAPSVAPTAPLALLVVVDTSPSMQGLGLGHAGSLLRALAAHVQIGDHVLVMTTGSANAPMLELDITSDADTQQIDDAAAALDIESEHALNDTLDAIIPIAEAKRDAGYAARVVLIGDGEGDETRLDEQRIRTDAAPGKNPILFSAFGTGSSSVYFTSLYRRVASVGRGTYAYVDQGDEATRLMASWDRLWRIAYDDVKVKLAVPDSFYVLQDADMTDPSVTTQSVEPQYVAPGGLMVFKLRLIPCEFGYVDTAQTFTVQFDYLDADQMPVHQEQTATFGDLKGAAHVGLTKMLVVDAYVTALMLPSPTRLQRAIDFLGVAAQDSQDPDLAAIAGLLSKHPALP